MQNTIEPLAVTLSEAAAMLGYSQATIRNRIKDKTIPAKYVSRLGKRGNMRINRAFLLTLAGEESA